MLNKKRYMITSILFFLSVLILINSISALDSLGTFKQYDSIIISQVCSDATYINISSISYPNSSLAVSNIPMLSVGNGGFQYNFSSATSTGRYDVRGISDGCDLTFATYFLITPNGTESTTSDSILYTIFLTIFFGIFLLITYFIFVLPNENVKNQMGNVSGVVKLKYLRVFFIAIDYALIILILNLMNGLAVNYASLTIFAGIIGFLFEILLRVAWVFTILLVLWIIYMLIQDSNVNKNLSRLGNYQL